MFSGKGSIVLLAAFAVILVSESVFGKLAPGVGRFHRSIDGKLVLFERFL